MISSYRFKDLPPEVIGTILAHLTWETGSEGILNQKDRPVLLRYAGNLALTCRQVWINTQHIFATKLFCASIAEKYGIFPLDAAAELNTTAARRWIWEVSQTNGDRASHVHATTGDDKRSYLLRSIIQDMFKRESLGKDPTEQTLRCKKSQGETPSTMPLFPNLAALSQEIVQLVNVLLRQEVTPQAPPFGRDCLQLPVNAQYSEQFFWCAQVFCGLWQQESKSALRPLFVAEHGGDATCLQLRIYKDTPSDFREVMKSALQSVPGEVISKIQKGWKKVRLCDYPDILLRQSEETHSLYLLENPLLSKTADFIGSSCRFLGCKKYSVGDAWTNDLQDRRPRPVYLWLPIAEAEEIIGKLGLVVIP